ncbi:MAG: MFS transporter [Lentisphaerota bacterium]
MKKPKNFWIYFSLLFVIALDAMCFGLVYPVFILIFTPGTGGLFPTGASIIKADILFGVAMACFPIGALLGGPLLGDFSDQIGRKKVILMCLVCECIGLMFFAVSISLKSVIMLSFVRFFTGFMAGTVGLAQAAIVDISAPERKTVNLSFVSLAASVGFIVGPLFGGIFAKDIFVKYVGYMMPFYFASLMCLISFLMILVFFKETSTTRRESKISLIKGVNDLIYGFMDKKFRKASYILLLMQTAWCTYFQSVTVSIVQVLNLTIDDLTYYMVALCICYGFTMLLLVRLAVKFFKIETILIAAMTVLVFGFILGGFKSIVIIWIALIPIGIGVGLSYMALLTLFSNYSDEDAQGLAMGIAAAISSAGWFIGPLLSGVLLSINYYMPHIVSVLLIMVGIGFSARLVYKSRN